LERVKISVRTFAMVSTAANKNMPAAKYKIPIKLFWEIF
jgi:hypothetical protein